MLRGLLSAVALGMALLVLIPVLLIMMVVSSGQGQKPPSPTGGLVCSPGHAPNGSVAGYGPAQVQVAAGIAAAAAERHLPPQATVIATATAMQESGLRPVNHGDQAGPDSRGPFQQRASWGPEQQRMDPKGAASLFFDRLTAIPNWASLPVTVAAQQVQHSAFPGAYQRHEAAARQVAGAVQGISCPAPADPAAPNPHGTEVTQRALSQVGVPYAWGGGGVSGPTPGHGPDAGVTGFDCSGLAQFASAASGAMVPHQTGAIWEHGGAQIRSRDQLQPGDLVVLSADGSPGGVHHVGIYLGGDAVVEAPQSGQRVQVREHIWDAGSNYQREFLGGVRPGVVASTSASARS